MTIWQKEKKVINTALYRGNCLSLAAIGVEALTKWLLITAKGDVDNFFNAFDKLSPKKFGYYRAISYL